MPDTNRIDQLRAQTQQNPTDPLGFFSLGRALLEANQLDEAVLSLQRAIALDSKLSRAYQLLAQAQLALGRKDEAIQSLKDGVIVATQRGDLMPKNEMIDALRGLGVEAPTPAPAASTTVGDGQVLDRRTGVVGTKLPKPPFKGPLGQLIYENVSAESWREWIGMGTKVINELRLPMNDPRAQKMYDQHMIDFLNLGELAAERGIKS